MLNLTKEITLEVIIGCLSVGLSYFAISKDTYNMKCNVAIYKATLILFQLWAMTLISINISLVMYFNLRKVVPVRCGMIKML